MVNARDMYGLSKFLGELTTDACLTIRTSIIGRELNTAHSIVEWFLGRRNGTAKGYVNAIYSGFPTVVIADIVGTIITSQPSLRGLYHVSSDPIDKFEMLSIINKTYKTGVLIEPFEDYHVDRSLDSSKFRKETGFQPQGWPEMIGIMAADTTPYEAWRLLPATSMS
jgi:dTDP-4-dehydrorhamnose reductase